MYTAIAVNSIVLGMLLSAVSFNTIICANYRSSTQTDSDRKRPYESDRRVTPHPSSSGTPEYDEETKNKRFRNANLDKDRRATGPSQFNSPGDYITTFTNTPKSIDLRSKLRKNSLSAEIDPSRYDAESRRRAESDFSSQQCDEFSSKTYRTKGQVECGDDLRSVRSIHHKRTSRQSRDSSVQRGSPSPSRQEHSRTRRSITPNSPERSRTSSRSSRSSRSSESKPKKRHKNISDHTANAVVSIFSGPTHESDNIHLMDYGSVHPESSSNEAETSQLDGHNHTLRKRNSPLADAYEKRYSKLASISKEGNPSPPQECQQNIPPFDRIASAFQQLSRIAFSMKQVDIADAAVFSEIGIPKDSTTHKTDRIKDFGQWMEAIGLQNIGDIPENYKSEADLIYNCIHMFAVNKTGSHDVPDTNYTRSEINRLANMSPNHSMTATMPFFSSAMKEFLKQLRELIHDCDTSKILMNQVYFFDSIVKNEIDSLSKMNSPIVGIINRISEKQKAAKVALSATNSPSVELLHTPLRSAEQYTKIISVIDLWLSAIIQEDYGIEATKIDETLCKCYQPDSSSILLVFPQILSDFLEKIMDDNVVDTIGKESCTSIEVFYETTQEEFLSEIITIQSNVAECQKSIIQKERAVRILFEIFQQDKYDQEAKIHGCSANAERLKWEAAQPSPNLLQTDTQIKPSPRAEGINFIGSYEVFPSDCSKENSDYLNNILNLEVAKREAQTTLSSLMETDTIIGLMGSVLINPSQSEKVPTDYKMYKKLKELSAKYDRVESTNDFNLIATQLEDISFWETVISQFPRITTFEDNDYGKIPPEDMSITKSYTSLHTTFCHSGCTSISPTVLQKFFGGVKNFEDAVLTDLNYFRERIAHQLQYHCTDAIKRDVRDVRYPKFHNAIGTDWLQLIILRLPQPVKK